MFPFRDLFHTFPSLEYNIRFVPSPTATHLFGIALPNVYTCFALILLFIAEYIPVLFINIGPLKYILFNLHVLSFTD